MSDDHFANTSRKSVVTATSSPALLAQARPFGQHAAAVSAAADHEHRVAMRGPSPVSIFAHDPAEPGIVSTTVSAIRSPRSVVNGVPRAKSLPSASCCADPS
jgi:hypothetical protein